MVRLAVYATTTASAFVVVAVILAAILIVNDIEGMREDVMSHINEFKVPKFLNLKMFEIFAISFSIKYLMKIISVILIVHHLRCTYSSSPCNPQENKFLIS